MSLSKLEALRALLRSCGSCLVAYSGGVDSVFLAYVAREVLGDRSLAVIADSPSLPRRELDEALALGERFGFPVRVVRTREFESADYLANPTNRCYFCKHELFTELAPIARAEGFAVIAYGENASDVGDYRPGAQAAAEFQVRAPLKETGLTKAEIREFSAQLGLPTADKPQLACLSSRIPHGEAVTVEKLSMIEQAENFLRDLGFHDVRVRHHEMQGAGTGGQGTEQTARDLSPSASPRGEAGVRDSKEDIARLHLQAPVPPPPLIRYLARIEVGVAEMPKLLEQATDIADALRKIGYAHVTLDLQGYRRGSLGETVAAPTLSHGLEGRATVSGRADRAGRRRGEDTAALPGS